jgi:hypothetical protein
MYANAKKQSQAGQRGRETSCQVINSTYFTVVFVRCYSLIVIFYILFAWLISISNLSFPNVIHSAYKSHSRLKWFAILYYMLLLVTSENDCESHIKVFHICGADSVPRSNRTSALIRTAGPTQAITTNR